LILVALGACAKAPTMSDVPMSSGEASRSCRAETKTPLPTPLSDDDNDGLSNSDEAIHGADPYDADTDDDGLLDGEEVKLVGLMTGFVSGTRPTVADTDGDGLLDGLEVGLCAEDFEQDSVDPLRALRYKHAAANLLPDFRHPDMELPLLDADPASWTDPAKRDTDGDGYCDGPAVWMDRDSGAGQVIRAGEDYNSDGKCVPEGEDGELETKDDESDPSNGSSHSSADRVLVVDEDRNYIPDFLEDWAWMVGQMCIVLYDRDPAKSQANVLSDAASWFSGHSKRVDGTDLDAVSLEFEGASANKVAEVTAIIRDVSEGFTRSYYRDGFRRKITPRRRGPR
jgi:hypothetical protein